MIRGCGRFRRSRLTVVVLSLVAGTGVAYAHEAGTTRVVASFTQDDTYTIDVSADAGALLARLEVARHLPRSTPGTLADYQRGFDLLCDEIPRHLAVMFDGVRSTPQTACFVNPADTGAPAGMSVPGVTVALRGKMPTGARTFAWQYGLTFASYSLSLKSADQMKHVVDQTVWLEGDQESRPVAMVRVEQPSSRFAIARTYFTLGLTHILPGGPEHVLFVLGIFLLSRRFLPMLMQVTAFTVAQSITLALTLNGRIAAPLSGVEPMLALFVVYVAFENLVTSDLKPWRLPLVFGSGLLHGMGAAGVLREPALPHGELLTGWAAFNAGIEAGQLGVIVLALLIVGSWVRRHEGYRRFVVQPGSAAIALTGVFWTIQRLVFR